MDHNTIADLLKKHCYSFHEAMEVLEVNKSRLKKLMDDGRLPVVPKEGTKLLMKEDVEQLKKELREKRQKYYVRSSK